MSETPPPEERMAIHTALRLMIQERNRLEEEVRNLDCAIQVTEEMVREGEGKEAPDA